MEKEHVPSDLLEKNVQGHLLDAARFLESTKKLIKIHSHLIRRDVCLQQYAIDGGVHAAKVPGNIGADREVEGRHESEQAATV